MRHNKSSILSQPTTEAILEIPNSSAAYMESHHANRTRRNKKQNNLATFKIENEKSKFFPNSLLSSENSVEKSCKINNGGG